MQKNISKIKTRVAFLDRDGVINRPIFNNGYIGIKKHFRWVRGSIQAIKLLKERNYKVVVVSNQSGVARGYFTISNVQSLHKFIQKKLLEYDTKIDKFYFCPYHEDGIVKKYKKKSIFRKPNIGMFNLAKKKWNIDKKHSFIIGDQMSDMKFAKNAKIKGYLFKEKNLLKFIKKKIFKK